MSWEKLPPVDGGPNPCLNCPPIRNILGMDRMIAVGFGYAGCTKDGVEVLGEDLDNLHEVAEAEALAVADPDHDWRIVLDGPMHGETYQRQSAGKWVLVDKNEGFA